MRSLQAARNSLAQLSSRAGVRELGPFVIALLILQLSQVFLYPAGADVSPYAWATGELHPNEFAGVTVQTWAFALVALVAGVGLLRVRLQTGVRGNWFVLGSVAALAIIGAFTAGSLSSYLDGIGKLALPLLVYCYLASLVSDERRPVVAGAVIAVNVFTVGQVLACFLATGSFSSHIYYHELTREYFGFYNHPFAFAGVLGVCSIVALYQVVNRRAVWLNVVFLLADLCLITASQVRTYIVATGAALVAAGLLLLVRRGRRKLAVAAFIVAAAGVSAFTLLRGLAGERSTKDPSSGRLDRWWLDLQAFVGNASIPDIIFGGGPERVFEINFRLSGVSVNSLNFLIDNFIGIGVVGSLLFLLAWGLVVADAYRKCDAIFVVSLVLFILVAALLSNVFEFPVVTTMFAVALTAMARPSTEIS